MNEQMLRDGAIGGRAYRQTKQGLIQRIQRERADRLTKQATAEDQGALTEREKFIPSGTTYDVDKREFRLPEGAEKNPVVDELNRAAGTINPQTGSSGRVQVSPEVLDRLRGGTGKGITGAPQEMSGNEFVEAAREYLRGEEKFRPEARGKISKRAKEAAQYYGRQELDIRGGRVASPQVFTPATRGRYFSDTKIKYPRYGYMGR